jgi:hypothetical protein
MTRPALVTLLAGAALIAAGCGGRVQREAAVTGPVHRGPGPFGTEQVRAFFESVTGDSLKVDPGTSFDSLSTADGTIRTDGRYGTFLIYVVHRPGAAPALYQRGSSGPIRPDTRGVYWRADGGTTWTAMKAYRNVVLEWITDQHVTDGRFKRLDTILSKLGETPAQARAALPAGDQPCAARGIGAARGPEGTCRSTDGATVTVVDRGHRLRLPDSTVRVLGEKTGSVLVPRSPFGSFHRAKGRFVYLRVGVRNTGDNPLDGLYEARLLLDGRTYDQDVGNGALVTPLDAFPLQPGEYTNAGLLFDVPRSVARAALRRGVLVFPADMESSTVDDASQLGEIRLGQGGAGAGGPITEA